MIGAKLFLLFLYVLLPALAIYLCEKYQFLNRIGSVVLCYVFGLVLGPLGASSSEFHNLLEILMSICVPLAIPLLLFSSNVKEWRKLAVQPFYSLLFAMLAVIISVALGYLIFNGRSIEGFDKVGGMLVGIYSGGTPNLASLKLILDVDEDVYLAIHSYDMAIGAVYLFILMSFGQRLFQLILPKYTKSDLPVEASDSNSSLISLLKGKSTRGKLITVLFVTVVMVAVAGGVMLLMPESAQMVVFIFLITAFGIFGSSMKTIRTTEGSFDMGMYLILIFSIVVSSKVEINNFTNINPSIFYYITFVVFTSLILHVFLARLRKIDVDTVIITSTALICSPPFVPVVAGSLRNRNIIVPGLTIGLIGYAVGNYLGYLMSLLLTLL
ncbi:DUF819 family protein [Carboxylicivirga sp. N1Y90]|uniref:DUF819 family protein n=1 Tax=Carboxylicivirga fragile TaxID=3417571 RepID=UPI003D32511A|nr:DUF819 family protein [Marinilabiliaceae bacterium N1Y90]